MVNKVVIFTIFFFSCRPLVTTFNDIENAKKYTANSIENLVFNDTLKVMTWNIRFGAARIPWFGDSCGDRVIMSENEVITNINQIIEFINNESPDILLVQEIDIASKRSSYIDQVQYILDQTHFNYASYASMWNADLIPSDGLGKVDVGNAIFSRWKITDANRIQLRQRQDQDLITQYFYLRRNILKAKIKLSDSTSIYAVNIHATAFATDNTKEMHILQYKEILDEINNDGITFITGGDLNSIPPGADSTDYCIEDMCSDEQFNINHDIHREGSYFENFPHEPILLKPIYIYHPAIDSIEMNNINHFTHSPWNTNSSNIDFTASDYWDRKLDYLFTNFSTGFKNGQTHQEAHQLSDHAPVSATIIINSP